jgi:hypothetical protein
MLDNGDRNQVLASPMAQASRSRQVPRQEHDIGPVRSVVEPDGTNTAEVDPVLDARERRDEVIDMLRKLTIPQASSQRGEPLERTEHRQPIDEITIDRPAPGDWYFAPFQRAHNADI